MLTELTTIVAAPSPSMVAPEAKNARPNAALAAMLLLLPVLVLVLEPYSFTQAADLCSRTTPSSGTRAGCASCLSQVDTFLAGTVRKAQEGPVFIFQIFSCCSSRYVS
eukprot:GHRR01019387.1.p2 GENE.GHRR01019387.1~~GHRR01019387.1.p2  ORF type:complete len:108 (-),score=24.43 GHRR01019387.1:119-442(-)